MKTGAAVLSKIFTILFFTLANVTLAQIDSKKIGKGKWIYHGVNGAAYCAMVYIPYHFFADWWLVAALLSNRLLAFNISLNLFRKLKWCYMPKEPKSIIDKMAKFVFGTKGKLAYTVYFAIFYTLLTIIFW